MGPAMKSDAEIRKLISEMTLEEKASLCSGKDFWHTQNIDRLNIPSVMLADGPHGLRKQEGEADHVGINESVPAACFPTASALGSSWSTDLLKEIGETLAETCLEEQVGVLLGPGINIKRSPLCGRNFEYFSEDPVLSGELAAALISGTQSKGIGTSLKHFAANNQEKYRMTIDAIVDERALREIYLRGFEIAVKKSQPETVMCAYNKINGEFASENEYLLTEILRNEWGFDGIVVSDWGSVNDRVKGLIAGMDLEMPGTLGFNDKLIVDEIKIGHLSESILDESVFKILKTVFKAVGNQKENFKYNRDKHHALTVKAAAESMVLLKNDNNILPLNKKSKIALIGEFAEKPRYQGAGSSLINPFKLENAFDNAKELFEEKILYSKGYDLSSNNINTEMIQEAVNTSLKADIAVIIAGLTEEYESEGFDREHMRLPESHNALIEAVAESHENVIVVLCSGAPVEMPWIDKVSSVVFSYLSGQGGGKALWKLLTGEFNFSGKLAETFPKKLSDCASSNFFPMGPDQVEYRESLFVGYRWFDSSKNEVLFPFGFGLSYTDFTYSDLEISSKEISESEELSISLKIKNSGKYAGSETVQIYIKDVESTVFRPEKELKKFSKIFLQPGEQKALSFTLNKNDFAFYDAEHNDWSIEDGSFEIIAAASSQDLRLTETITINTKSNTKKDRVNIRDEVAAYYNPGKYSFDLIPFEKILGRKIQNSVKMFFDRNTTFEEAKSNFFGRILYKKIINEVISGTDNSETSRKQMMMMEAIIREMPLRNLLAKNGMTHKKIDALIDLLNGKLIKGIWGLYFKK